MRITESMILDRASMDIMNLRSKLFDLQRQATSGERLSSIEEDPVAAERIRLIRSLKEATMNYDKNITMSYQELQAAEGALEQATNLVVRLKEIAMAMGTETVSGEDRAIVAEEVSGLFDSMLRIANTQAGGLYIFGGYQTDSRPFQNDGTFVGDDGVKDVDVGPGTRVTVNISGEDAFTIQGGVDIFVELTDLRQALENNDVTAIQNAIGTMDQALNQLTKSRVEAGVRQNRLDVARGVNASLQDSYLGQESALFDADPIKVLVDLNATTSALENAVAVARKVTSASFMSL